MQEIPRLWVVISQSEKVSGNLINLKGEPMTLKITSYNIFQPVFLRAAVFFGNIKNAVEHNKLLSVVGKL